MPFQTIKEKIETQIVEKKSKFIATLLPVSNKKEQEEALQKIKKQYLMHLIRLMHVIIGTIVLYTAMSGKWMV